MSRERFDQTIVDELERELRSALAIEPSPDFPTQVRARIARHASTSTWTWLSWPVLVGATACCVIALAVGWTVTQRQTTASLEPATVRAGVDVRLEPVAAVSPPIAPKGEAASSTQHTRRRHKPDVTRTSASEPEVIVASDAARAITRLLELARSGAVDEESLRPIASPAPSDPLRVAPIVVAPLSIPDIGTHAGTSPDTAGRE